LSGFLSKYSIKGNELSMVGLKEFKSHRELLYLVPPLLVYLFASFLFELSVIDPAVYIIDKLAPAVKASASPSLPHLLTELKARYIWLASALLNIIIPVMSIAIAISTIKLYLRRWHLAWTVIIGIILSLGNIGYLLYGAHVKNALYELIFGFTYMMLIRSEMFSDVFLLHVYIIILIINILASVTPIILLLAVCATLRLPTAPCKLHPDYLAKRMRRLKEVINVGSAFLVFGILHMSMWLNWTASLVTDPALSSKIAGVAWSIAAYWGVAFTLVLAATYVPATVYLQNQAVKQISRGKTAMEPKEAEKWLNEHGFSFTLSNQLTQCISIMAPILAAPISSILKSV
jgi:hypothetical protein